MHRSGRYWAPWINMCSEPLTSRPKRQNGPGPNKESSEQDSGRFTRKKPLANGSAHSLDSLASVWDRGTEAHSPEKCANQYYKKAVCCIQTSDSGSSLTCNAKKPVKAQWEGKFFFLNRRRCCRGALATTAMEDLLMSTRASGSTRNSDFIVRLAEIPTLRTI